MNFKWLFVMQLICSIISMTLDLVVWAMGGDLEVDNFSIIIMLISCGFLWLNDTVRTQQVKS